MMLLAIDTATQQSSLALHDGRSLMAEQSWVAPNNHTVELAPTVQALLDRARVPVTRLKAIAVSTGPGSFTGLRIGVALAKGIASAQHLPLVGVPAHDIQAAGTPQASGGLVAVLQAGRGRIIAATYQWRKGRWSNRGEPRLMDWETLFNSIDGPANLTGEVDEDGHEALAEAQARDVPVTLVAPAFRLRRAGVLAGLAQAQLAGGGEFPPALVTPLYVRTKDTP